MNFPVIDLNDAFGQRNSDVLSQIKSSCTSDGCFYVTHKDFCDDSLVESIVEEAKQFFHRPLDAKMKHVKSEHSMARGYRYLEQDNVDAFMGRTGYPNNANEAMCFGPLEPCPYSYSDYPELARHWHSDSWPENMPTFKIHMERLYGRMIGTARFLMKMFSTCFNLDEHFFRGHCIKGAHNFNVNFYPIVDHVKPLQERFAAHRDANLFTLYAIDYTKDSLMVKNSSGLWKSVNLVPDSFVVMIGDSMERWTNDQWKSCEHKVAWPEPTNSMQERVSIALFVKPKFGTLLSGIVPDNEFKHKPITFEEFMNEKLQAYYKIIGKIE